MRQHTANESRPLDLVPANQRPPADSNYREREHGRQREISSNAVPDHEVGRFPNRGNPNEISEQSTDIVIPANPEPAEQITPLRLGPFGIALNGVFFDPGAAEFWQGNPRSGWQYEALGGAVPLGIDENHAHVQPTGTYHYHGLPTLFLKQRKVTENAHSPQVGWAADGFPVYALYGYEDPMDSNSEIVELEPSYRLKDGDRPDSPGGPGGEFDGAFVADYEYDEGSGDLDECNGRFCVTPEYPEGTYAYFLTEAWPVIPRAFRGTPTNLRGGGSGQPPGGRHPDHERGKGPPKGKGKGNGKGAEKGRPPFPPSPPPRR